MNKKPENYIGIDHNIAIYCYLPIANSLQPTAR